MKPQCFTCQYHKIYQDYEPGRENYLYCLAFPDGIPDDIKENEFIHKKAHPKQKDKSILYKKIDDDFVAYEKSLSYPLISPSFTFLGFRKIKKSPIFLCSCSKEAVKNYIKFNLDKPKGGQRSGDTLGTSIYILNDWDFPVKMVESLIKKNVPSNEQVLNHLQFKDNICHACNKITPFGQFCDKMYGSVFKQKHGWYIKQQAYEFGINPSTFEILKESCPKEILDLIDPDIPETIESIRELYDPMSEYEIIKELYKRHNKQSRKIMSVVENEVRLKFGYTKIGESWTSEMILFNMVKKLLPQYKIIHNYQPDFLQGLEIDIYIEDIPLGIEYQGIQHFKPMKHWGGSKAFTKLKERDKKKKCICQKLGIPLIYFQYNEKLNEQTVMSKIVCFIK